MEKHCPVAIVGMSCFFPKSSGLKAYWRLLFHGQDAITEIPATHWSKQDYFDPDPTAPDHVYCARGGFLSAVDFDPSEFGIPPSSLEATDSSQLLALAAAKQALQDTGLSYERNRTSVILGVTGTQELVIPLSSRLGFPKWRRAIEEAGVDAERCGQIVESIAGSYVEWQENSFPGLLGNVVAGRISNRLDLGGTNCVVDAACASSFAAVHLALLELALGRSDMVITGGVDTLNDIFMHMCFAKTRVLSPTGDARPFSKDADGTVLGEGVGILVLKRLADAERDGNRIYAVIKGIGSSSDGRSQSIYAPRIEGQVKALDAAYSTAGIDPATVDLVEAHGTGTRVGDKIEFQALCDVLRKKAPVDKRCALGSVKSMIGHTKAAAGAAGLIKTALALYHKVLPPTLKADAPDPALNIESSPFYLNTRLRPWVAPKGHPRRAGVSAFGFGGSNFHLVLEEHRAEKPHIAWTGSIEILAFSGARRQDVLQAVEDFSQKLDSPVSESGFAAAAAQTRVRFDSRHAFRFLMWSSDPSGVSVELKNALHFSDAAAAGSFVKLSNAFFAGPRDREPLAFIFPGQGSQYVGMGCDMFCTFPRSMAVIENAERRRRSGPPLADLLFPRSGAEPINPAAALQATDNAQPAIGTVSLAMLKTLEEFGVTADAVAGHSFGELTALCAAGRISEADFFDLAIARGKAMAQAEPGAMLAVQAPLRELDELVAQADLPVVVANRNSPQQAVLSGGQAAISEAAQLCQRKGYAVKALPVGGAFHSPLMQRAKEMFEGALQDVRIVPAAIPVFSNSDIGPYPEDAEAAKRVLAKHLLRPVDFVAEIEAMHHAGIRTFVEVGPKSVLTALVASILKDRDFQAMAMDASAGRGPGLADLAQAVCHLAALGYPVRLENWESPPEPAAAKPRMRVPITGANYRSSKAENRRSRTPTPEIRTAAADHLVGSRPKKPGGNPDEQALPSKILNSAKEKMTKAVNPKSDPLNDAVRSVQEGLKAIQTIQIQTAQAHQKFLETQSEASRILLEMIKRTSRLAGITHATAEESVPTGLSAFIPEAASVASAHGVSVPPDANPSSTSTLAPDQPDLLGAGTEGTVSVATFRTPHRDGIENSLLAVVSELTGYPQEMLGLDMDIEADLGIDSIKRVEILSTLGEKMPGLPAVAPEDWGRLKTLGQIIGFISESQIGAPAAVSAVLPPDDTGNEPAQPNILGPALLAVVSELTGYPQEMLGLDMDIEADLGIDSIKRVEILSTLEEKLPGLPAVAPEDLGRLKTLGQIIDHLSTAPAATQIGPFPASGASGMQAAGMNELPRQATRSAKAEGLRPAPRRIITVTQAPALSKTAFCMPPGRHVVVTGDHSGLSQNIAAVLDQMGISTVLVPIDILKAKNDLPHAAGLIIIADPDSISPEAELKHAFELTTALGPDLLEAGRRESAFFATVTRLDGAFGFNSQQLNNPLQGALAGLAKTAALEWPPVRCHALDVDPVWQDNLSIAEAVCRELMAKGPVEIGLSENTRRTLTLAPAPYPAGAVNLDSGDVVLITGGARGITAACALELARRFAPTLILLGRSPGPAPEPAWLHDLEDEAAVKKALLENEFNRSSPKPAELEARYRQLMANREILRVLNQIQAAGGSAQYYCADIRDGNRVAAILADVRSRYGPLRAVIHAAGVLEDRLIVEKNAEQFSRVFDTKVKGFQVLLEAVASDDLKYMILFSSITARLGNKGQVDYAMANEALNKMAIAESLKRPGCRVISINWGPWEGGMVTSAHKREFERQGVTLLPISEGVASLIQEMAGGVDGSVEVVIGGTLNREQPAHPPLPATRSSSELIIGQNPDLEESRPLAAGSFNPGALEKIRDKSSRSFSLLFEREIDLNSYPILKSHMIDGQAVVPLALMAEWFGHGALHENPGLLLHGLEDIRILNGIRLGAESKLIRLLAGKARRRDGYYEVDLELRNGVREGKDILHCRAKAVLAEDYRHPPSYRLPESLACNHYPRSTGEIYDEILFHGRLLHGLKLVQCCTADGMVAEVAGAPDPSQWMTSPLRNSWLCDPLVLDSAFQMASLWCYDQRGSVSLPSHAASYRQFRPTFPRAGAKIVLEVRDTTEKKMRGDFMFLDLDGEVIAQLTGYEAIMDPILNRAFKSGKPL